MSIFGSLSHYLSSNVIFSLAFIFKNLLLRKLSCYLQCRSCIQFDWALWTLSHNKFIAILGLFDTVDSLVHRYSSKYSWCLCKVVNISPRACTFVKLYRFVQVITLLPWLSCALCATGTWPSWWLKCKSAVVATATTVAKSWCYGPSMFHHLFMWHSSRSRSSGYGLHYEIVFSQQQQSCSLQIIHSMYMIVQICVNEIWNGLFNNL